ncbi:hypothetical protein ANTQUA_LOCUS8043 [Anthophora quadrimaculata]
MEGQGGGRLEKGWSAAGGGGGVYVVRMLVLVSSSLIKGPSIYGRLQSGFCTRISNYVFTLAHYETTGVIINARCISRLESGKGAGGNIQRKTRTRATGFEARAYQFVYMLQRLRVAICV